MSEVFCSGGTADPLEIRDRNMPGSPGAGLCPQCGEWFKLTAGGVLRRHRITAPEPAPETPTDGSQAASEAQDAKPKAPEATAKTNPTPDLTDEQYLEQMALIAQSISVMPAQREGLPNVTTPPPIRPLWARFMLSLGLRIHPELATHKLRATGPKAAGNFGPRQAVPLNLNRESLTRDDLMAQWKEMNPESFHGIQSGSMTREALLANMPEQMRAAVQMAEDLKRQEAEEQAKKGPPK